MPSMTVTHTHNGTAAESLEFGKSYIKFNLSILNRHKSGLPADETEVDAADQAKVTRGVRIIDQAKLKADAIAWNRRAAARIADLAFQDSEDQAPVDDQF